MEIIVEDISSYIADITHVPRALAMVRDVCRARPSGYQFMPGYRRGSWDGYISLMRSTTRFPTGLLWFVADRLQKAGFALEYNIKSVYAPYNAGDINDNMLYGVTLRDYQLIAIRTLLEKRRGIAKMATNSGKTEVMAGIIKALGFPKTTVIVNRKELLHQTADRFEQRLGITIGKIGDGLWQPADVTVAMIQTLHSKLKHGLPNNQLLMIDECHHTSSDTTLDIINSICGAYRFGFSGTPLKHDLLSDMKLIAATGRLQVEVTNADLIDKGYSARPIVHITTITNDNDDMYIADYQTAYKELIVDNEHRNIVIAHQAKHAAGVVLILVNQITHGKRLLDLIPDSVFVSGIDETSYRQGVLSVMRAANRGVFIASPIFDEGVDIPAIDTVILACGGKSHVKLLQRIGRGLRKKDNGNNVLHVYDFIDDTNKHLLHHSEARIDTYVAEGFETRLSD